VVTPFSCLPSEKPSQDHFLSFFYQVDIQYEFNAAKGVGGLMSAGNLRILDRLDSVSARILVNILDKADKDGLSHGIGTAEICYLLAMFMDQPEISPDELWIAGLFHDIGKLGLPRAVIDKVGPLSPAEFKYVKEHTKLGKYILDRFMRSPKISEAALLHHERMDGAGYPKGLSAEEIPIMARIVAVAECYDSIRSASWVFKNHSHTYAIKEIQAHSGKQFDPAIVDLLATHSDRIHFAHKNAKSLDATDIYKWI
jgi:putative nucleotidyltransferase with HDIG domain